MTESSQQEFFLDHFQKVRDVLEGGDVRKALGIMLDVRENGFVNKELDSMIDLLRDDPPKEVVDEALRWSTMIVDRLTSFGGDVFQLVEEFSEASLGLSEAEWVPVEEEQSTSSGAGEVESMEFEDIGDMDFDLDLDDVGSQELEMDLDFSDDDDQWDDLDALDELSELGELSGLDELSGLEESSEEAGSSLEESSSLVDFAVVDGATSSEARNDTPAELIRENQETKPHPSVADEDRETKPHQAASRDDRPRRNALRETVKQPAASQMSGKEKAAEDEVDNLFDGFDFDDSEPFEDEPSAQGEGSHSFVEQSTRRSDSLDEVNSLHAAGKGEKSPPEPFQHRGTEASGEQDDDDFDFDLGFENPESRVETPVFTSQSSEPDDDVDDAEEADDDDFDFDLGFENPESKTSTPGRLGGGDVKDSSEFEHDLDFDMGRPSTDGRGSSEQSSGSGARRDSEVTPASMPSIPRFQPPKGEEASTREDSSVEVGNSLDDDEFFELAESLTSENSEEFSQQGPYRGEPLMNSSNPPTSTPPPTPMPAPESELSEVSQGRERVDTPNPFAHEAPTGVQQALVDSHSSFVLEEIRDSEVSEAKEDEVAVGALMSEARRLYEKGKFESAHDLLDAVIARDDSNDDAQDLMGTVEGELERQHQAELGSLSKVPELKVKMSDIPTMNLDHRFGFLLSQIDGMSTFEDILELSSMTRLETLEVLAQMLDRDIIEVS